MFKKIDQFMVWALSDAPGSVRLIAWPLLLPIGWLVLTAAWLSLPDSKFKEWLNS